MCIMSFCTRAIYCSAGSLHPAMELLLRHTIQFLSLRGTTVVAVGGILDNVQGFLDDLGRIEHSSKASAGASTFENETKITIDAAIAQAKWDANATAASDTSNPVFEREGSVDVAENEADPERPKYATRTGALAEFLQGTDDTVTEKDQQCILSMLLLAAMMDGDLNRTELQMWQSACEAVGSTTAEYYQDRIELLCDRYRSCDFITARDIHNTFDPTATVEIPALSKASIAWWWVTRVLSLGSC